MDFDGRLNRGDIERLQKMETTLEKVSESISEIKQILKEDYVTQVEFDPIRRLVYGSVGLILVGFLGGLAALVWG